MDQILERAGKFRAALKAQFTGSFTTVHEDCGNGFYLMPFSPKLLPAETPNPLQFPATVRARTGPEAVGHVVVWHHELTAYAIQLLWDEGEHPQPGDVELSGPTT